MVERIALLFEILSIILVLLILHGSKKLPKIYTIIYACLELIIVSLIGEGWLSSYFLSLIYIGMVVVDIFEFNDSFKNSIICALADYFFILCFQLLGIAIFALLFHTETISSFGTVFINAFMFCSLLLIYRFSNVHIYFRIFLEKGNLTNGILVVLSIVLAIMFKMQISKLSIKWDLIIFTIIFFWILILVIIKLEREKMQKTQYVQQLKQYQQYSIVYKDMISEIRHRQHDFNNHLQALYSMGLAYDNIEDLRKEQFEYLKKIENDNQLYHLLKENVSSILVAFLYIKFKTMKEQKVQVDYSINIIRVEKIIPFPDLVELIGNLLDNAFEATIKNSMPKIWFEIEESNSELHLLIQNSYEWDERERSNFVIKDGFSSKGKGHGFGLSNVNKIIEKYRGILEVKLYCIDDIKVISFDVVLPLSQEINL